VQVSEFNLFNWKFDKFPEGVIITFRSGKEEISFQATPTDKELLVKYFVNSKKSEEHYPKKIKLDELAELLGFNGDTKKTKQTLIPKRNLKKRVS
jgi:hypothetical protein